MPTFNVIVPEGRLSSEQKIGVAVAIGRTYKELTGVPENLTQVIGFAAYLDIVGVKGVEGPSAHIRADRAACPSLPDFHCRHETSMEQTWNQNVLFGITYPAGNLMASTSVQFTVAAHIMAALGFHHGKEIASATLAESVNADPTFVRKSLSKLSKAGLIMTTRGKNGASVLTRSPKRITLLDIYRASAAPPTFAIHSYPVEKACPVSSNIKECMESVLRKGQDSFEKALDEITLADVVGEIRRASQ